MDSVGGPLKKEADMMVALGADIQNASDFTEVYSRSKIVMLEIEPLIRDEIKQTVQILLFHQNKESTKPTK